MIQLIDRRHAGELLAEALAEYGESQNTIVFALPRGGVPVGDAIAARLHLPLDIIVPRKIGMPDAPEVAIGAITESGEAIFDEDALDRYRIDLEYIEQEVQRETAEAKRRIALYRGDKPFPEIAGKTVIITDDGIATGFTMQAAIQSIKQKGAERIIVAVPVAPPDSVNDLKAIADEVIVLDAPDRFMAVGYFYADFAQISDEEVMEIMGRNENTGGISNGEFRISNEKTSLHTNPIFEIQLKQ